MENKTQDKGFTLVELLIVIVILGILATVTVFAVRGITEKGEENACQTDKATFETATEAWYALDTSEKMDDGAFGVVGNGHPSEPDLVGSQLIRELSNKVDVTLVTGAAFATVIPDATSSDACTASQLA
jgi:prepilin-type N-terminal cleavage/methylation domain-containing protein